jgi:hypothetical protein
MSQYVKHIFELRHFTLASSLWNALSVDMCITYSLIFFRVFTSSEQIFMIPFYMSVSYCFKLQTIISCVICEKGQFVNRDNWRDVARGKSFASWFWDAFLSTVLC